MPIYRALSVVDRSGNVLLDIGGDAVGAKDGNGRYDLQFIEHDLLAASVDTFIWVCQEGIWQIQYASEGHTVVGGAGANVQVVVCPGGVAIASGTAQLTAALDLTVTAPKVQHGTLITTPTQMFRGDALGLDFSGTLTGLVGSITVAIQRRG